MMNNLSASWLSVIHEKLTWVRLYTLFLTALSTEIFRIVQKDLSLCSFRIWAQRWKLEAKRPSGSRDMADLWFGKKKLVGGDSNPGRGVFSTFLMNAWCNSDKWHIRRCTILFHIERTGSGQNLESGSCVNRVRLIAVFLVATWHAWQEPLRNVDRTWTTCAATYWSKSYWNRFSTSWETSITRFRAFRARRLRLWAHPTPRVWDESQMSFHHRVALCSSYMFAKGQTFKFILYDPNYNHPFPGTGFSRKKQHFSMFDHEFLGRSRIRRNNSLRHRWYTCWLSNAIKIIEIGWVEAEIFTITRVRAHENACFLMFFGNNSPMPASFSFVSSASDRSQN